MSPPDANRGDGCINGDPARIGFSDSTAQDDEGALEQRYARGKIAIRRIVNQFVQHHPRIFTDRERAFVDKDDAQTGAFRCFHRVALVNGRILVKLHPGAVGTDRRGLSGDGLDAANGFRLGNGSVLGVLPRRHRPGKFCGQFSGNPGPGVTEQGRGCIVGEEIANDDLRTTVPGIQDQVAALARIVSGQYEIGAGDREFAYGCAVENKG